MERDLEERNQAFFGAQYRTMVATLMRLCQASYTFQAFMTWLAAKQYDGVRKAMNLSQPNHLLDAFAGVTRLCVGASVKLAYRTIPLARLDTFIRVLNQEPALGSVTNNNNLVKLTDRFLSHRFDIRSEDYIPPYNPSKRHWCPDEEAWRYLDARATDQAVATVSSSVDG